MKSILVFILAIAAANISANFLSNYYSCPKFVSRREEMGKSQVCASVRGELEAVRTNTVYPCRKGLECFTDYYSLVQSQGDYDYRCKSKETPVIQTHYAYPGEACSKDNDCKGIPFYDENDVLFPNKEGMCRNNVCVGSLEGKKCPDMSSCNLRFYCDVSNSPSQATPGICKPLKKKNERGCKNSSECENGLICLTFNEGETKYNKCSEFRSLELGTKVETADYFEYYIKPLACKSGYAYNGDTCAEVKYDSDPIKIVNGKVECEIVRTTCWYTIHFGTEYTEKQPSSCMCQYSANGGTGYCPFSKHDPGTIEIFNAIVNIKIENYSRPGVHPVNRHPYFNPDYAKDHHCLFIYEDITYYDNVATMKKIFETEGCTAIDLGSSVNERDSVETLERDA